MATKICDAKGLPEGGPLRWGRSVLGVANLWVVVYATRFQFFLGKVCKSLAPAHLAAAQASG